MAIRDLITSDPYYQNLVNPRGFPNTYIPSTPPTSNEPESIQPEYGLQNIMKPYLPQNQGNDGNNQNVRTDYNSRPGYESAFGLQMGDPEANMTTGALNNSGVMGSYQEQPQSATGQFLNQAMNFMPGIGGAKRAMEFLGGALPPNQRAILENELRGSGVYTDDIGRVVGDINTAEGVMTGYNANKITDQTYTNRRNTIANTLSKKYNMSQADIDAAIAGTYEGDIETSLIGRLDNLNKNQFMMNAKKKQAQGITDFQNKKRDERKEAKLQEEIRLDNLKAAQDAQRATDLATVQARAARGDSMSDIGKDMYTGSGQAFEAGNTPSRGGFTGGKKTDKSPGGYNSPRKDGGMIGYRDGGLASMFTRRR